MYEAIIILAIVCVLIAGFRRYKETRNDSLAAGQSRTSSELRGVAYVLTGILGLGVVVGGTYLTVYLSRSIGLLWSLFIGIPLTGLAFVLLVGMAVKWIFDKGPKHPRIGSNE